MTTLLNIPDETFLAHIAPAGPEDWRLHELAEHLQRVGLLAAEFATPFGGGDWVLLAGKWHDLGKYRQGFQRYIRQCADAHIEDRVPSQDKTHSAAGALHALEVLKARHGPLGHFASTVLAYLIAGHHAGLADWHEGLKDRLKDSKSQRELTDIQGVAPAEILNADAVLDIRTAVPGGIQNHGAFALWMRMLFSALVDADFLDTETFMNGDKAQARGDFATLAEMRAAYNAHMACFAADTPVRRLRADILRQCRDKAALSPGLFTLSVPTGGGKTLASLGFALDHALAKGKRRIIYAIPYTSIIEQTADVFRDVFASLGRECVVEHHSQVESEPKDETSASRLACENWDAPLVVTTNVQLFESLFAARTSRCRKLHNLTNSVLILDEAQQLPVAFLQPILDVLRLLIEHYGVSVVLCTATQPALTTATYFDAKQNRRGLDHATELMDDPDALYAALKRVTVELPADFVTPTPWAELAQRISAHDCVLAIVNTRDSARELYRLLPKGTLHLSALMCGAHRKQVIDTIKARLAARRAGRDSAPLRVVSTQLVEAGVDLDFPVVYREKAGLDSIAQAAGRCNREGSLAEPGKVVVFVSPKKIPSGELTRSADACVSVLHGNGADPLARPLFYRYFEQFYRDSDLDLHKINELLTVAGTRDDLLPVAFRSAAERFRLISDAQVPVVVLYQGADGQDETVNVLLGALKKDGPQRWLMRALQRFIVNVPSRQADTLLAQGDLELAMPGLYVQANDLLYDIQLGLVVNEQVLPAGGLVC